VVKKIAFGLFIITLICSISRAAERKPGDTPGLRVSLIRLIADPVKYDGKKVQVLGFLSLPGYEGEGNALYLHREDYEKGLLSNAICVLLPRSYKEIEKYDRKYVLLEGIFKRCDETQYLCLFSGYIEVDINSVQLWAGRAEP
jgi:hypothetical protein